MAGLTQFDQGDRGDINSALATIGLLERAARPFAESLELARRRPYERMSVGYRKHRIGITHGASSRKEDSFSLARRFASALTAAKGSSSPPAVRRMLPISRNLDAAAPLPLSIAFNRWAADSRSF